MKYTFLLPAYKAKYLKEALESIVAQSYTDWQCVVSDDCSPEDLHAIVKPYLADARIRYWRNEKNCGAVNVVDNWNICLGYCTGDYVICIGDDDRLKPCCLEEYAKLIAKFPGLDVYHARTEIIDEESRPKFLQEERPQWESALSLLWNRLDNRANQYIGDFCYNTERLRREGGYYKLPLAWGSDDITAVRAARGKGIANTQVPAFEYRQNSQTITSSKYGRIKAEATIRAFAWFDNFVKEQRKNSVSSEGHKLETIDMLRDRYIRLDMEKNCQDDVHGNPLRLPYWHRFLKPYNISPLFLVRWYIKSLLNVTMGK